MGDTFPIKTLLSPVSDRVWPLGELDDASGYCPGFHFGESGVDLVEGESLGDHFVEFEAAVEVHFCEAGHVGAELV